MEKILDIVIKSIAENASPITILLFLVPAFFIYSLFQANAIYRVVIPMFSRV